MTTGDSTPINTDTNAIDLNNGGWTLITILICIIVTLIIILFIQYRQSQNKIKKMQQQLKQDISEEETNVLLSYRNLNERDKTVLHDTLKSLSDNSKNLKE